MRVAKFAVIWAFSKDNLSRLNRFFVPGQHAFGQILQLDAERSNYACKVLRLTAGDALDIFNGVGDCYRCELVEPHQRRAKIRVEDALAVPPPSNLAPSVAIGLLKGQAMDRAIQQAVELGANDIWLLQAQRSNVPIKGERLAQKLEHWRRIIASACEQCGRLWMPMLRGPDATGDVLSQLSKDMISVVFDPHGESLPAVLEAAPRLLFIGPEGGWSEDERALFEQNQVAIYRLGPTVLRAETMPGVALALVQQAQGWR